MLFPTLQFSILIIVFFLAPPPLPGFDDKTPRHNGSCMMGYDQDGDGDLDLINGDILGNNLLYLENSGIPGRSDSIHLLGHTFFHRIMFL